MRAARAGRVTDRDGAGWIPDVDRIAVLRANAIGDLVVALPALDALRAAYPDAEITLLGRRHHAELLGDGRGPVDRVVVLPDDALGDVSEAPAALDASGSAGAARADLGSLLGELRARRFDVAIQLHGGGRHSNPLVGRLGARITAGSRTPDAAPLDRMISYEPWQSEVARYLDVVSLVGARPVGIEPRLPVCPGDRAALGRELPDVLGARYVVIHPGASDPRRRWPAERFAAVGRGLASREPERRIVVTGIRSESALLDAVADAIRPTAGAVVADRLSLPALLALLAGAELVVANDSGPLHLAVATGARSIGLFWIGNLINAGPFFRRRHRALASWRQTCPTCGAGPAGERCAHDPSFIADIELEAVLDAAASVLASEPLGAAR